MRIRLTDDDRGRLGVPEWLDFDTLRPHLGDLRKLKEALGWTWTAFEAGLNSDDVDTRLAHRAVLWWLAVNRHADVPWDDFDVDILGVDVEETDPNSSAPSGA